MSYQNLHKLREHIPLAFFYLTKTLQHCNVVLALLFHVANKQTFEFFSIGNCRVEPRRDLGTYGGLGCSGFDTGGRGRRATKTLLSFCIIGRLRVGTRRDLGTYGLDSGEGQQGPANPVAPPAHRPQADLVWWYGE